MIEFTDPITGEILNLPTEKPEDVRKIYELAKHIESVAKQIRYSVKPHAEKVVEEGDGKTYQFKDGVKLTHVSGQKFKIPVKVALNNIGDAEMLSQIASISKSKFEEVAPAWLKENKIEQEAISEIKKGYVPNGANDHYMLVKK